LEERWRKGERELRNSSSGFISLDLPKGDGKCSKDNVVAEIRKQKLKVGA